MTPFATPVTTGITTCGTRPVRPEAVRRRFPAAPDGVVTLAAMTDHPPGSRLQPLARGLAGTCPHCGGRGIFRSLAELTDTCPTCGFSFVREDGYWVGAMTVIMALILLVFGAWFVGGMLLTWPEVPWTGLLIGGIAINGLIPLVLYGWSKTIWVGLDLTFNPARADELRPVGARHVAVLDRGGHVTTRLQAIAQRTGTLRLTVLPPSGGDPDWPPAGVAETVVVVLPAGEPVALIELEWLRRADPSRYVVAVGEVAELFDEAWAAGADAVIDPAADDETVLAAILGPSSRPRGGSRG